MKSRQDPRLDDPKFRAYLLPTHTAWLSSLCKEPVAGPEHPRCQPAGEGAHGGHQTTGSWRLPWDHQASGKCWNFLTPSGVFGKTQVPPEQSIALLEKSPNSSSSGWWNLHYCHQIAPLKNSWNHSLWTAQAAGTERGLMSPCPPSAICPEDLCSLDLSPTPTLGWNRNLKSSGQGSGQVF